MFDWSGLEQALLDALLAAARGPYRAAALGDLYAETDGVINPPLLYLNTDGKDMDSPPDWETLVDDWAPSAWMRSLIAEACSGTVSHWDETFALYQDLLARICVATGARLGYPVFYVEHSRYEEMLGRCLTPEQMRSLFPEVVAARAERARVAALPPAEQVAYHVSRLHRSEEAADALRHFGSTAVPALLPLLRKRRHAWIAAKLLAEIGIPDPAALEALSAAVSASTPDSPAQLWPCRALAQLGRLDLVLAQASRLSPEALAIAVTARYASFRDVGLHPLPLDYRPLEDFLPSYPEAAPFVSQELAPGQSYCEISAAEVPEAMRGTTSPHVVVRRHAVCVLGNRRFGEEIGAQVIPLLRDIAGSDPDSDVRRLAALSVEWWKAGR